MSIMRRLNFSDTSKILSSWGNSSCFQYHLNLYTMQEPSHLSKIALSSTWFRMVLTINNDFGIQSSSHLEIPTMYQQLIDITILIPMSFFLDTIIIDVAYTSRKLCQKESQHYGSFDQPDLQLLNNCKFIFLGFSN